MQGALNSWPVLGCVTLRRSEFWDHLLGISVKMWGNIFLSLCPFVFIHSSTSWKGCRKRGARWGLWNSCPFFSLCCTKTSALLMWSICVFFFFAKLLGFYSQQKVINLSLCLCLPVSSCFYPFFFGSQFSPLKYCHGDSNAMVTVMHDIPVFLQVFTVELTKPSSSGTLGLRLAGGVDKKDQVCVWKNSRSSCSFPICSI